MTESSITEFLMKQISEKDQEISKLRDENKNNEGVIAELQKKLDTFKIKAPIEEITTVPDAASADITIKKDWSQIVGNDSSSVSQDPPVIQATPPQVPAPKKKDHGYTEGRIEFDWKKKTTKSDYTYWYTFIKPTNLAHTNGLNVYVSVDNTNDIIPKETTVYFMHEEGHAKRDGSKTVKCTDNLLYTKEALSEMLKKTS